MSDATTTKATSSHYRGLFLLLIIALLVRIERAWMTTVVNPDTMRFIAQGKEFFINPLRAVRQEVYHPLQSVVAALVHNLIMIHLVHDDRMAWIISMQTVGVLAGSLVAIEIFWIARRFGAPAWACYAAAVIWIFGRKTGGYGADGISDMLFLSLLGLSLLLAMKTGLRYQPWYWLSAGVVAGLSYLTRPEGVAAVLIMLWALLIHHGRYLFSAREPTARVLPFNKRRGLWPGVLAAFMLCGGYLIVGLPYMIAIGGFTRKKKLELFRMPALPHAGLRTPYAHPMNLAFLGPSALFHPWMWLKIAQEVFETYGPATCIVLLAAMALCPRLWGRRRWRPAALGWAGLWVLVMLWLLNVAGYLHGRHTLVLVLLMLAVLALGLQRISMRVQRWMAGRAQGQKPPWLPDALWGKAGARRISLLLCFLICIPGMVHLAYAPQRGMRFIKRGAAWLKTHAAPRDIVAIGIGDDRRAIVAYYSGLDYMYSKTTPFHMFSQEIRAMANHRPIIVDLILEGKQARHIPTKIGSFVLLTYHGKPVLFRAKHTLGANTLAFYVLPSTHVLKGE